MRSHSPRPGPKGVFLLGSLPAFRRDPLEFCTGLARDYGDLAFFRLGPIQCVQVNRPEWIQHLLTKEAGRMHKSWDYRELAFVLGEGLVTSEGDLWKRQRRLIQPAFHNDRIRTYAKTMVERAGVMLEGWRDGQELELSSAMSQVTLEIVGRALFGADVADDAKVISEAITVFMDRFEALMTSWVPLPVAWPLPGNRRALAAIRRMDEVVYRMVRERRASSARGDDLLSWLIEARDEQGALDDKQLRDELVTLLLAGHETTSLALTWTLMLLSENPDVERRLARHLDEVLRGRAPQPGDEPNLGFTRQVVEEGMRLRPPVWGAGREALEDIALGEFVIPKGTQIFFTQWVTHHDPRFFPNPEHFDPDRWSADERESIPRYAYFPFGGGPRVCVGMNFAMMEATLLLAAIVQRFHVEVLPGQTIELQPAVTLRPKNGIRVKLESRTRR